MRTWMVGVASLVVGLMVSMVAFGVAAAPNASEDAEVYWQVQNCWITLTVHSDVDLGVVSGAFSPGDALESAGHPVTLRTNCANWQLSVSREDFTAPAGHSGNGLQRFYQWVDTMNGAPANVDMWTEANWDAQVANGGPGNRTFQMNYKYELSYDDVPGDYSVTLVYTATSN